MTEDLRWVRQRGVRVLQAALWTALCFAWTACGGGDAADSGGPEDGPIVIGVAWPWEARSELLFEEGLEMALAEVQAAGGIGGRPLEVVRADDLESVNEGRLVAQRLADDPRVVAVIGHLQSHVTVPAASVYDAAGLVMLSPTSTSADLTSKGYSRVFRGTFTDHLVGEQMADYAIARGYGRIAVYYVRSIYGRALANGFEERIAAIDGFEVVARNSYDAEQDLRGAAIQSTILGWQQRDIDAIFLAGEVPSAGSLIAEIREAGIDLPILGGDAMSSPALLQIGGEAVEGTVVACFFHPAEPREEVTRFVAAFEERYGQLPDAAAALAYDAVHLLARAMRDAASPTSEDIATALHGLQDFVGVTGPFTFDAEGNLLERSVPKAVVHGGSFVYLEDEP